MYVHNNNIIDLFENNFNTRCDKISLNIYLCNVALYGSSACLLGCLQSVLNSAVRLILNVPKFSRISSAIRDELHWLTIERHIRTRSLFLSGTALLGWHRNTWWSCAVR